MPRITSWTKLSAPELRERWNELFDSEEEATAMAIWIGNRLVKDKAKSTRRKFYSLKDMWLSLNNGNLIDGRIARTETAPCYDCEGTGEAEEDACPVCDGTGEHWSGNSCWTCDGTGEINTGGHCDRCGGSGVYKSWFLYEHQLIVADQRYSFHSYLEPKKLSETPGADLLNGVCNSPRVSESSLKNRLLSFPEQRQNIQSDNDQTIPTFPTIDARAQCLAEEIYRRSRCAGSDRPRRRR